MIPSRLRFPALLGMALLAGCEDPVAQQTTPLRELPRPLTASERELISASNAFAFGLLREVHGAEDGPNVFLSPLSASLALGMTMNGARGPTLDAMRGTLGFGAMPLSGVNESYQALMELLRGLDPRVDLRVANSIWYRRGFPVEQPFLDTTRGYFGAEVAALDFASPSAPRTINDWVKRATNGKIDEMVGEIPANAVMYLMNAIYFKGSWTHPFDRGRTADDTFLAADGSRVPVRMMTRQARYGYLFTPEYDLVDLPYGSGAFTMTVLLPKEGRRVEQIVASLDDRAWADALARMAEGDLVVSLPRFELEYEKGLNDALKALGMEIAFTPDSDFTAMSPADPWIDLVFQKSYVQVNEEGTEAAAATGVTMVTSAPPSVRVDRPFLFAIRERFSGAILFVGVIGDPSA